MKKKPNKAFTINEKFKTNRASETEEQRNERLRIRMKMIEKEGETKSTRGKEKVIRNRRPPETSLDFSSISSNLSISSISVRQVLSLKCAKTYLFLFDIIVIATNGKPNLKRSSSILPQFCSDCPCCLVCHTANV